ncbi:mycothiol transferase [Cellulomonas massiliensis]|uniref:mycothiol transferase n=1 Tax=Cellulomonas massiliensis TaxID=1465811 RepID=UPI0002FBEA01|nr:DUF664 domain-containing protein [Cellulomonas massiliensis]
MDAADLLRDTFGRVPKLAHGAVDGLTEGELSARVDSEANTVAWLLWHTGRGQDAQLAEAFGTEQVWETGGWRERFGLPLPAGSTGYGHSSREVAAVRAPAALLTGYVEAVAAAADEALGGVGPDDLDRVVDTRWDPPVTLGVRLVSVVGDALAHLGQAAYVRGLLLRAR